MYRIAALVGGLAVMRTWLLGHSWGDGVVMNDHRRCGSVSSQPNVRTRAKGDNWMGMLVPPGGLAPDRKHAVALLLVVPGEEIAQRVPIGWVIRNTKLMASMAASSDVFVVPS